MIRWYLGGIGAGTAIGWFAARCQLGGWAPIGLLSLGVGLALGYMVSKLAASSGVCCPRRLVVGTVLFALVSVVVEHTWHYHDFRRQWVEARTSEPTVALFRPAEPWTPAEYFRHELSSERVVLWCIDATLIVTGAVGVVIVRRGVNARKFVVADDANTSDR